MPRYLIMFKLNFVDPSGRYSFFILAYKFGGYGKGEDHIYKVVPFNMGKLTIIFKQKLSGGGGGGIRGSWILDFVLWCQSDLPKLLETLLIRPKKTNLLGFGKILFLFIQLVGILFYFYWQMLGDMYRHRKQNVLVLQAKLCIASAGDQFCFSSVF